LTRLSVKSGLYRNGNWDMTGPDRIKKKRIPRGWKLVIQGLPLAGAAATTFLPLPQLGHQFAILIVLLWLQVFFLVECFFAGS
jgi:hypothetical protein